MIVKNIEYIHEPTDLQCGQAVLAMILGVSVSEIIEICKTDRETKLKDMSETLAHYGVTMSQMRKEAQNKSELPQVCILSLETPRCWHWSLYAYGTFYDPEHGVMPDFPECKRKYYWEISE